MNFDAANDNPFLKANRVGGQFFDGRECMKIEEQCQFLFEQESHFLTSRKTRMNWRQHKEGCLALQMEEFDLNEQLQNMDVFGGMTQ